MSSTLDGDLIRKGDTVYLQCEVKANPSVHTIHWTFEVGGMEQPVLRQIKRKGLCSIRVIEVFANCKIRECTLYRRGMNGSKSQPISAHDPLDV